jgi:hypothetical protein
VSLAFAATIAFKTCGTVSSRAAAGIEATLKLLTLMESPHTALPSPPPWLIVFGWGVCVIGWLFLPLVIGAIFESALSRSEADMKTLFTFYQIGAKLGFIGEDLTEFAERVKEEMTRRIKERGGKQK